MREDGVKSPSCERGLPAMSVKVNLDECIGCGVCEQLCPEVFTLDERDGKSMVISQNITSSCKDAADSCPVSAISCD